MFSLISTILASVFLYSSAFGDGICGSAGRKIVGKTTLQCKRAYESFRNSDSFADECGSLRGESETLRAYSICIEKVMNSALDSRLLKLKKKNPHQFKKEMEIQAAFNKATSLCLNFSSCSGSMYRLIEQECETKYQLYRAEQAELIAKSALEIHPKTDLQDRTKLPPKFREFAKGLCEMPPDIWKSKSIPKNCETLVVDSLPFDKDEVDPCPEQEDQQEVN